MVLGVDWGGFGRPGRRRLPERISWWPPGTSAQDLLGPCLQDFGGFRVFWPGVSQIMMLIRGLQDAEVYALGSLWFLVLRRLYDWGGLGPKAAQKWFNDPEKPKKAQTVREEPKEAQNWSGRSPKSSEMVHKMVG